jgi:hypothetical protein
MTGTAGLAKMRKTTMIFKKGDFVRVKDTTHDSRMPFSRLGHILEEYKTVVHYTDKKPVSTGQLDGIYD